MLLALFVVVLVLLVLVIAAWLFGERGHILLPSTRRSIGLKSRDKSSAPIPITTGANFKRQDEHRSVFSRAIAGIEGYVYGRWTNQYINILIHHVGPRLGPKGRKWLSDRYHGKVLTPEQARAIVQLDFPIKRDLEQIVPYPMARDFILSASPHIAAYECACRHARPNPCQPTQVCMLIGESAVNFMLEHNPKTSRRLTQSEALEMLRLEHERGHVHSAWFKSSIGNRFYAICNCCKCCCGGIEQMTLRGVPMVASSGFVVSVNPELCGACATCVMLCPFDALTLNDISTLDWEKCMGCGVCIDQCPTEALSLVRDEKKGIPLDVRTMAR